MGSRARGARPHPHQCPLSSPLHAARRFFSSLSLSILFRHSPFDLTWRLVHSNPPYARLPCVVKKSEEDMASVK